jgi:hypothetical protein
MVNLLSTCIFLLCVCWGGVFWSFELRALLLLGKCSLTWASYLALFVALVIFQERSVFFPGPAWTTTIFLTMASHIGGMAGMCYQSRPLDWVWVSRNFYLGLPWTAILSLSAYWGAEIIDRYTMPGQCILLYTTSPHLIFKTIHSTDKYETIISILEMRKMSQNNIKYNNN